MPNIGSGINQNLNQLFSSDGVIRNADTIVNDGNAFTGVSTNGGSVATSNPMQLFNPVGSGVTIFVDSLLVGSTLSQDLTVALDTEELTLNIGAWVNNKSTGAVGKGRLRTKQGTLPTARPILLVNVSGINDVPVIPKMPWELPEGHGLTVTTPANDDSVHVNFFGREFVS